jgi:hypothetical protein
VLVLRGRPAWDYHGRFRGETVAARGHNWTVKVEYLYIDLGSYTNTLTGLTPFTPIALSTHVTDNIVRAGVNYHFNFGGPIATRY